MTSAQSARKAARTLTLDDVRATYYEATGQTSAIVRQLAFAGIAIIWILSGGTLAADGALNISTRLLWAGLGLVVALGLDLLQYAYRSVAWGAYARHLEMHDITEVVAPDWINKPAIGMFALKTMAVMAAYLLLAREVVERLNP